MDFDILDSLDDLGYSSGLDSDSKIKEVLEIGPKSIEFTQLVEWLSKELQALCGLDSCINSITDPDDSSSFLLEVSSFLKELQCPYKALISGPISQRLLDVESRLVLVDYLTTELQASRLLLHKSKKKNFLEIEVDSSDMAVSLSLAKNVLNIETGENDDCEALFCAMKEKVNNHVSSNSELLLQPALEESLTEQQWDSISNLHKDFMQEYQIRRELLLTRLDVTVASFKWGEGSKGKEKQILNAYLQKRSRLNKTPSVKISDLLAARESILEIEKTSSVEVLKNTKTDLYRIIIAEVPDRGGRPKEQRPTVEMPNWMKRSAGGGGGGRGFGGHRGRGGNRGGGDHHGKESKKYKGHKGGGDRDKGNYDAAGSY